MKKLVMKDLLGKSLKELVKMRNKLRKELYDFEVKNSLRSLQQTHLIRLAKRNIARINTAMSRKTTESVSASK